MKNSHIRFVSSKNYFFIFIFPSSVSVTGSPKCPPPTFQEASLICKWECRTNQEWLDKAETQVFQHCVTDGELQRYYRPSFKEDLSCRTLCFSCGPFHAHTNYWTARPYIHAITAAANLGWQGRLWIIVSAIISQLPVLLVVPQHYSTNGRDVLPLLFFLRLNQMATHNGHHTGNYKDLLWGDIISLSNRLCLSHSATDTCSLLEASLTSKLFL